MTKPRKRNALATLVAASALLTACGTTVPNAGRLEAGGAFSDGGLNGAGVAGTGGLGGGTAAGGTAGGGAGPAGALGTGAAGLTGSSVSGGGGTTGSGSGPGSIGAASAVTPGTIKIGLIVNVNNAAAAGALGVSGPGVGGGPDQAQWNVLINYVNTHGGIVGHKIEPVWATVDATSTQPIDTQEQSMCSTWTQDNHVFAAVAAEASADDTLLNCLNKAGVVQLWEDFTQSDYSTYQQFPYYVEGGTAGEDRIAAVWPQALKQQGYFSGWSTGPNAGTPSSVTPVKVGVVSFDNATPVNAVNKYLKPALAAAGYQVTDYRTVLYPSSQADQATTLADIQSVVLHFASEGITHVLPFDAGANGIGYFFALNAHSQHYYPRFGLNSGDGAQVLINEGLWPSDELAGSMGYGWVPLVDLAPADDPTKGPYSNAARQFCVSLMDANGQTISDPITERQVVDKCDALFLLKASLEAGGGAVTRSGFAGGVARLGSSFVDGFTFGTSYGPAKHDGASLIRLFDYQPGCGCFRYTSQPQPFS